MPAATLAYRSIWRKKRFRSENATAASYLLFASSATKMREIYTSDAAFFTTNFSAPCVASETLGAGKLWRVNLDESGAS